MFLNLSNAPVSLSVCNITVNSLQFIMEDNWEYKDLTTQIPMMRSKGFSEIYAFVKEKQEKVEKQKLAVAISCFLLKLIV